jgi:hypothetical protein
MSSRKCLTPGAVYNIWLDSGKDLEILVEFPDNIAMDLTEEESKAIEQECGNAVEAILARYWKRSRSKRKSNGSPKNGGSSTPRSDG